MMPTDPFGNVERTAESIKAEFREVFGEPALLEVCEWAKVQTKNATREISRLLDDGNRFEQSRNENGNNISDLETYLTNFNPRNYHTTLASIESKGTLFLGYRNVFNAFAENSYCGEIVKRYEVPKDSFKGLLSLAYRPLHRVYKDLSDFSTSFEGLFVYMESSKTLRKVKKFSSWSAIAAGSLAFGFVGSLAVRKLLRAIGPSKKLLNFQGQIRASHVSFNKRALMQIRELEANLEFLLLSIVGGLFLRLDGDLNDLGKRIKEIRFSERTISVALSKLVEKQFKAWAEDKLNECSSLYDAGDWNGLIAKSDAALVFVCEDPLRSELISEYYHRSYVLVFTQYRAVGLSTLADYYWNIRNYDESLSLYGLIVGGPSLGCEDHSNEDRNESLESKALVRWLLISEGLGKPEDAIRTSIVNKLMSLAVSQSGRSSLWSLPDQYFSCAYVNTVRTVKDYMERFPDELPEAFEIDLHSLNRKASKRTNYRNVRSILGSFRHRKLIRKSQFGKWVKRQALGQYLRSCAFLSCLIAATLICVLVYMML